MLTAGGDIELRGASIVWSGINTAGDNVTVVSSGNLLVNSPDVLADLRQCVAAGGRRPGRQPGPSLPAGTCRLSLSTEISPIRQRFRPDPER
ncbi:MAG UNVERIFIED_CONTAM: hypothetical protein LVR18_51555 [Planctomycetaceae bacterium]